MRYIMLDTETTGLSPQNGDRMIEIGALEVCQRKVQNEKVYHQFINPERPIPANVVRIHGIDDAKVKDEPTFKEIAPDFLDFIQGATLVIHNAPFDLGFIMHELAQSGLDNIDNTPVIDTLALARQRYPNQRNSLDALCDRFDIERGHRTLHGALLDAELLAEVYLAITGGNQFSLLGSVSSEKASNIVQLNTHSMRDEQAETAQHVRRDSLSISTRDSQAHQQLMARIEKESGGQSIWRETA